MHTLTVLLVTCSLIVLISAGNGYVYPKSGGYVYPKGGGNVYPKSEGYVYPKSEGYVYPKSEGYVYPKSEGYVYPKSEGYVYPKGRGYVYPKSGGYVYQKNNTHLSDFIDEDLVHIPDLFGERFPKLRPSRINRCASCHCGWPNNNRIVGGSDVRFNKYPWIAQLMYNNRFYCGGSLINDKYILTAAHCTTGFKASSISARLLQYDRTNSNEGIVRKVKRVIAHPKYNTRTLDNDIALLELEQNIRLESLTRPVCLPTEGQNFDFQNAVVAGWGLTKEQGSTSQILKEVTVPVITNAQCRQTKYGSMITSNMICAGDVKLGGKDACQGDSGGPLIASTKKKNQASSYKLAGVVSFGYGCAKANAPGVYARVGNYLPWIYQTTENSCYCNQ